MKNLIFTLLFLSAYSVFSQNVVEVHYRRVSAENRIEFEDKELNHWAKVKQNAIDNGQLLAAAFFRVVQGSQIEDENTPTHAFVLVYKDFKQLAASSKIWESAKDVLGMDPNYISTNNISKVLMIQHYKLIDELSPLRDFKFAVWNYSKPKDFNGFVNENLNLWKPYFQNKVGTNGLTGWGILARVYPQGMNESSIVTYDHYENLESALFALSPMDFDSSFLTKSKMSKYDPDGFRYRVLLELIQFQGSVN